MSNVDLGELKKIPGVGDKLAKELWSLGIHSIKDLRNKKVEDLYHNLCAQKGTQIDSCVLYVFRCAVYYASNKARDPELLKWGNWKDK